MYRSVLQRPEDWGFARKALAWGLALFLSSGVVTVPEAWAATYYVDAATGDDGRTPAMAQDSATPWKTLTKALANVASGDDVQVASGLYDTVLGESFPLALQDGVAVEGAGKATTTLSAPAVDPVFENVDTPLGADTVLAGFTLTHDDASTSAPLVHLEPISVDMAPVLDGNAFQAVHTNDNGISVDTDPSSTAARSFTGTLSNNTFDGLDKAIFLSARVSNSAGGSEVLSPTVSGNTFTDNLYAVYVTLNHSKAYSLDDSTRIVDNVATGSRNEDIYYFADFQSGNASSQPLISGNSFTGAKSNSILISYETLGAGVPSVSGLDGVTASPTITNNTIQDAGGDGIEVYYSGAVSSLVAQVEIGGNKILHPKVAGINFHIERNLAPQGDATDLDFAITNNTVTQAGGAGIVMRAPALSGDPNLGDATVTIAGNVVDAPGSTGIADEWHYGGSGRGTVSRVISGNTVTNGNGSDGIYASGSDQTGLDAANLDIHDNVVDVGFGNGIHVHHDEWQEASRVLASCNTVTHNAVGFVVSGSSAVGSKKADLGGDGSGSPGLNSLFDNTSGTDLAAQTDALSVQSNWWGTTDVSTILSHIGGAYAGGVDFSNFLSAPPGVTVANDLTAALSGDVITYTATLEGTGQCGCASSTFTAPTPDHTTIVPGSVTVSGASGPSVQGEDPVEVQVGALGAGEVVTVSWMVQLDAGYLGDVSEQASFGCTQLAAAVASDDPSTPSAADPTVINTAAAPLVEVPTLQTAGLATMTVLLLVAGWLLVERRRRLTDH